MKLIKFIWTLLSLFKWNLLGTFSFLFFIGVIAGSKLSPFELGLKVAMLTLLLFVVGIGINNEKVKMLWEKM